NWFFENFDNIIHQVAKKNPPINRSVVRQVLVETCFDSFQYVGGCVSLFAQAFRQALPKPLSAEENRAFEAVYCPQPYLAGLSLVLLRERFDFLREIILEMFDNPMDEHLPGVLLRMLWYYGEMVRNRREADRVSKQRSQQRNRHGQPASMLTLDEEWDSPPED